MISFDNQWMKLYMRVDSKLFEVTAICDDELEANIYLEANPDEGVIASDRQQGRVFVANVSEAKDVILVPTDNAVGRVPNAGCAHCMYAKMDSCHRRGSTWFHHDFEPK